MENNYLISVSPDAASVSFEGAKKLLTDLGFKIEKEYDGLNSFVGKCTEEVYEKLTHLSHQGIHIYLETKMELIAPVKVTT